MKRLFIAIVFEAGESFAEKYAKFKSCTCKLDRVNWVKPDLLHLTLKFLGDTEEERIPLLDNLLLDISKHYSAFPITLDKIGAFGSKYQPKVLWLAPSKAPDELLKLQNEIELKLKKNGFPFTSAPFVSHLTLARINYIDSKRYFWDMIDKMSDLFDEHFNIRYFVLYESVLQKGRSPQYNVLYKYDLQ